MEVTPRVTWSVHPTKDVLSYEVTLDNSDKEYYFAFEVSAYECQKDPLVIYNRIQMAKRVLLTDYKRQHTR